MLTNSQRLKIIAEAKRSGYKGSYLDLLKQYEHGGFSDAGMTGMMKAKIAMENQFGNNPAITRMVKPTINSYDFGDGRTGTHDMGSYGKFAIPNIQDVDGTLQYTGPRIDEAIKFDRVDDATYFAENYKDVAPMLKRPYSNGGPKMPTVNIPEVEISALTDETYDKLSQSQKKLYDLYQTKQGTRQTIPINVGRDRKVTQDIHYLDALNLAARNPTTQIYNTPLNLPFVNDMKMDDDGSFRAHYHPASGNIHTPGLAANIKKASRLNSYVVYDTDKDIVTDMNLGDPQDLRRARSSGNLTAYNPAFPSQREFLESDPARRAQMIENLKRTPTSEQIDKAASETLSTTFEEYAHADGDTHHPMQNFFGRAVTFGDRLRRGIKEGSYPDASNYSSKYDLEYHTHNAPNSAVNQLADRYGMDQYDMVNRKPTLGQYSFPLVENTSVIGDPRRLRTDYDPGLTKFKRAGGFANLPDPDSKPTMSQSLQRFMKQEHMPPMKNFEEGGMKDSSPQQYQVEVIKYPLGYKNMPPGHIESRILNVDDLPEEYGNVSKQLNPWPEGNRGVYYSPERNYAPGVETTVLSLNKKDLETYLDAAQKGDYNFLSNNCADQTCAAFGLDQSKYTALGVTTPQQVFDALKNDPRAVKGSTTGDDTAVEDTLKKVIDFSSSFINPIEAASKTYNAAVSLANKSAKAFKKSAARYEKAIAESKASARNREDGGLSSDSDSTIVQKNDPLVNAVQIAARSEDELRFDEKGIAYDIKTGERFGGNIIRAEDSTSNSLEGKIGLQHSPYGRSSSGKTDPNNLYYTNYTTGKVYTKGEYKKLLNTYKVLYNKTRKETE